MKQCIYVYVSLHKWLYFRCSIPETRTTHWLMNYIDNKAKCRHLKKLTCKGNLRQMFICLSPPPLLGFCLGWSIAILYVLNLVRYRVLNFCKIWSPTGLNTPPSQRLSVFTVLWHRVGGGGGGRVESERSLEGQQFTQLGRKYQHEWLYLQSINSDKHLPQSPLTGQFC